MLALSPLLAALLSASQPLRIWGVSVTPRAVEAGGSVTIAYRLSRPAKSRVWIRDPLGRVVRELLGPPGAVAVSLRWDGRDFRGRPVPAAAYSIAIEARDEAGAVARYEPASGPDRPLRLPASVREGVVVYRLPRAAWVSVRVGIRGGPLLRNIVFCAPRLAGEHREPWDGMDDSGTLRLSGLPGLRLLVEALPLPENSVVVRGGPPLRVRALARPATPLPIGLAEPRVGLELLGSSRSRGGLPVVRGKVPVRVVLQEEGLAALEAGFELLFFVDFRFVDEVEEGCSPCTWIWDTSGLSGGQHVLTVNVRTLAGAVSSASLQVLVEGRGRR